MKAFLILSLPTFAVLGVGLSMYLLKLAADIWRDFGPAGEERVGWSAGNLFSSWRVRTLDTVTLAVLIVAAIGGAELFVELIRSAR